MFLVLDKLKQPPISTILTITSSIAYIHDNKPPLMPLSILLHNNIKTSTVALAYVRLLTYVTFLSHMSNNFFYRARKSEQSTKQIPNKRVINDTIKI